MRRQLYITTSWDDGHPMDLRVAELLAKHNLMATFYIPKMSRRPTLAAEQIKELGQRFEIGGHTLHHVDLTTVDDTTARHEIAGCRRWIEDITGKACVMFCFPKGRYKVRHLSFLMEAGFIGARTTELLSLDYPRCEGRLKLTPITIQAYPQPLLTFVKNAVRRAAYKNLWTFVAYGRSTNWVRLTEALITRAEMRGGVFHLSGHSWEIEEYGLWSELDEVFYRISQLAIGKESPIYSTNGDVCRVQISGDR